MSTIFFAWELGAGLGHLCRIRPLARGLRADAHRVIVAARDHQYRSLLLADEGIEWVQAPLSPDPQDRRARNIVGYAHFLQNIGFGDPETLQALGDSWRALFCSLRPDLVIFDHSPIALCASRGLDIARVTIGNGFCIPPDTEPLPMLRPWLIRDSADLIDHERRVPALPTTGRGV